MRQTACLVVLALLCARCASAQVRPEWKDVIGTWEGDSTCAIPESPCKDEHVLFRIKPNKDDPDKLEVEAFKVVEKRAQFMGILPCKYAEEDKVLTCNGNSARRDVWTFHFTGDGLEGMLNVDKDRKVYRKIALIKKK
jgi:hypothetical protein